MVNQRLIEALERVQALLMRLPPAMRNHYLIRAALDEIEAILRIADDNS